MGSTSGRDAEHQDHGLVGRVQRWGLVAWSVIGLILLIAISLWALMQVGDIFPPLVLALVVIYVLNPLVSRLELLGVGRLFGACLSYIVLSAAVAAAITFLIPSLVDQGQAFVQDLPRTVERLGETADDVAEDIERRFGVGVDVGDWLGGRTDIFRESLGAIGGFLRGAVHTVALFVIGLVVGFYLLIDLPRLRRSALSLIPPDRREEAQQVSRSVGNAMGGFFRGQLFVALTVGIMSAVALRIVGLPYWLVIGMVAGFFNIIPLIGPYVGAIPAVLIAVAMRPPITVLWVVLALTVVQQIDNHLISPNVMRWTVRLHPVTIMLSLIVGATLAGFWGMLLAVPLVASGKVVAAHFWRTRVPWGEEVFEPAGQMEAIPPEQRDPPSAPSGGGATVADGDPGDAPDGGAGDAPLGATEPDPEAAGALDVAPGDAPDGGAGDAALGATEPEPTRDSG